jgi:UDP-N-acetylglucosamine 1-carboxyvinyltransferase
MLATLRGVSGVRGNLMQQHRYRSSDVHTYAPIWAVALLVPPILHARLTAKMQASCMAGTGTGTHTMCTARCVEYQCEKQQTSRDHLDNCPYQVEMASTSPTWKIEGGHQLSGSVTAKGSKNSSLAIICAALLTLGPVVLANIPRISDVYDIVSILRSTGTSVVWLDNSTIEIIRPPVLAVDSLDIEASRRTRAVVLLVAALAKDQDEFVLPLPGGCSLGDRSLEPHVDVLAQLGLQVEYDLGGLRVSRSPISEPDTTVTLLESGDTVTENAILTAVATKRRRVQICNASCNYMVQDLCLFLQRLDSVSIDGIGSPLLTISHREAETPHPIHYSILEDPIEAFFFIAAAIVTRSYLQIKRVPVAFISLELRLLQKMGASIKKLNQYPAANGVTELCDLEVSAQDTTLTAPEQKIHPNVYPFGVNVDCLPAFGPIATLSEGETLLHDWIYEHRASYFALLECFGACVETLDPHRARISGSNDLKPADCHLPPALRPASMVLLAALAAPGVSRLHGVEVLSRGHEDLAERLRSLGATIDDQEKNADRQAMTEGTIRSMI